MILRPAAPGGLSLMVLGMVTAGACTGASLGEHGVSAEPYRVDVPLGLDLVAAAPEDNALSAAKVDLGKRLFFDSSLSVDHTKSCASCHRPERYFTDGRMVAVGIQDREGTRNVPSILNAAYSGSFLWDGRVETLEEQMLRPVEGPNELGLDLDVLIQRLRGDKRYRDAFRDAFGTEEVSRVRVAQALASYVRTVRSGDAPVDRFLHGDREALSADARKGFRLFIGRANCGVCHLAPLFTDHAFHNTGVSWGSADKGRGAITGRPDERGAFKTPSLRNVARTAPYMHDGSIPDLGAVLAHYDRGGMPNPYLDEEIVPLGLTDEEKRQIIAFLHALTSEVPAGG